jgi:16S rRNA (adenine1518-N6/adenine1519-N6)-dimethyltransferase
MSFLDLGIREFRGREMSLVPTVGRPKHRRLGQNFLTYGNVARRIVALLGDEPRRVVEIGPGRGALTEPLLERYPIVRALELDERLIAPLEARLGGRGLEVVHADALTADLDELLGVDGRWQLAANLPYSVGSAILRRLLPRHDLFDRLVVMLQREVARRVVAEPGGGDHGLLALERAAWAEARIAFEVSPRAFRPAPKVVSAVLVLAPRRPPAPRDELGRALALAARALTRPRKMLPNALGGGVTGDLVGAAGIDPTIRPGELSLADWLRLSAALGRESHRRGESG